MKRHSLNWLLLIMIILAVTYVNINSLEAGIKKESSQRTLTKPTFPDNMFDLRYHDVGQLYLPITNYGIHGHEVSTGTAGSVWPKGSGQTYIFGGGIWIGAIKNDNKYVSVGYNPNSGNSELVPGFVYDPNHNYDMNSDSVRVLLSTDYPNRFLEENMPEWPHGYYHPDPDGNPETSDADTVFIWTEAGEGYKPVTVSVQDSYAWFSDVDQTYKFDTNADILGVEVVQQGYSWNYFFNQNFAFLTYDIKNASDEPLVDTYLSVVVDPDVGDGAEDMVGFDEERNLAYAYDADGREDGWATNPGYIGYVFLESPIDPATGEQLGLTAFRIFTIAVDPGTDVERYDIMAENGTFDVDSSPEDKRFCIPTGPFTLQSGETSRVVVGVLCAKDLPALQAACDLAQQMYDLGWVSPAPPDEPEVSLTSGDNRVIIRWGDKSESSIDPVSGDQDFEGYRLYKSRSGIGPLGNWEPADKTTEWELIAQWDLANEIGNGTPINPEDTYNDFHPDDKYLGDNTGLTHMYIDEDVINGVEYHYAVTSYDKGTIGIRSLECGMILDKNRKSARSGFYKSGYERPTAQLATHSTGLSTSDLPQISLSPLTHEVVDAEYEISFDITDNIKTFSVTNLTNSSEVVISNSANLNGEDTYLNGVHLTIQDEVAAGLEKSSGWVGTTETNWSCENFFPIVPSPIDYEIRFTERGDTTTFPADLIVPFEVWRLTPDTSYQVKSLFIFSNGPDDSTAEMRNSLTNGDEIKFLEDYYDEATGAWKSGFTAQVYINIPNENSITPANGDVFRFELTKPFSVNDKYAFITIGEKINPTEKMLENIKVVPNPYIVRNTWERSNDYQQIQFINLPEQCTIRIYTLAGDHVRTIEHDEAENSDRPGWEWWDLLTHNNQQIASGVYIFHIDAPEVGEYIGKFAIVK